MRGASLAATSQDPGCAVTMNVGGSRIATLWELRSMGMG